jgi:hypothetical protein
VTLSQPAGEDRALLFAPDAAAASVLDALRDHFLRPAPDGDARVVHRLAVFDAHGEVVEVITQMDGARAAGQRALFAFFFLFSFETLICLGP